MEGFQMDAKMDGAENLLLARFQSILIPYAFGAIARFNPNIQSIHINGITAMALQQPSVGHAQNHSCTKNVAEARRSQQLGNSKASEDRRKVCR